MNALPHITFRSCQKLTMIAISFHYYFLLSFIPPLQNFSLNLAPSPISFWSPNRKVSV